MSKAVATERTIRTAYDHNTDFGPIYRYISGFPGNADDAAFLIMPDDQGTEIAIQPLRHATRVERGAYQLTTPANAGWYGLSPIIRTDRGPLPIAAIMEDVLAFEGSYRNLSTIQRQLNVAGTAEHRLNPETETGLALRAARAEKDLDIWRHDQHQIVSTESRVQASLDALRQIENDLQTNLSLIRSMTGSASQMENMDQKASPRHLGRRIQTYGFRHIMSERKKLADQVTTLDHVLENREKLQNGTKPLSYGPLGRAVMKEAIESARSPEEGGQKLEELNRRLHDHQTLRARYPDQPDNDRVKEENRDKIDEIVAEIITDRGSKPMGTFIENTTPNTSRDITRAYTITLEALKRHDIADGLDPDLRLTVHDSQVQLDAPESLTPQTAEALDDIVDSIEAETGRSVNLVNELNGPTPR